MKANALALEYQRDYLAARGDLNVFDLVNNPSASGKCSVFGLSFGEKTGDDIFIKGRAVGDNTADSFVVAEDAA